MAKGNVTTLLSESRVQVMFGVGLPYAIQLSVKISPSFFVWLLEMSVISGGSIAKLPMRERKINRGYYMAARRYEISLRVLKNISRVSAANE